MNTKGKITVVLVSVLMLMPVLVGCALAQSNFYVVAVTPPSGKSGEQILSMLEDEAIVPGSDNLYVALSYEVVPAPTVTFVAHKNVYAQGEYVTFTITNTGTATINLPSTAPWWVEDTETGMTVYFPIAAQVVTPLGPGQSRYWIWDQSDSRGEQVSLGAYRIGIHWDGMTSYTQEFEVCLVAPTPTPTVTSTPTPTATPPTPGFGGVLAIICLLTVACWTTKRKR